MSERYEFVIDLIKKAGERVLVAREKHITVAHKNNDPKDAVTNVDLEVNDFLTKEIQTKFPGEVIYSEEDNNIDISGGSFWSLDPIDGTANFSRNVPHFAVVVAYVENGQPLVGAVYNPVTKELFSFEKGQGAFLNGKPIKVSEITELNKSRILMSTGRKPEIQKWGQRLYSYLDDHALGVRIMSGSALDICFVAAGRMEACIYGQLTTLDIVAALGILKEAGGIIEAPTGPLDTLSKDHQKTFIANSTEIMLAIKQGL